MRISIVGAVGTKPICGTENSDSHKVGIYVTCLAKDVDVIQIYVFNIFNMHIYIRESVKLCREIFLTTYSLITIPLRLTWRRFIKKDRFLFVEGIPLGGYGEGGYMYLNSPIPLIPDHRYCPHMDLWPCFPLAR